MDSGQGFERASCFPKDDEYPFSLACALFLRVGLFFLKYDRKPLSWAFEACARLLVQLQLRNRSGIQSAKVSQR